MRLNKKIVSLLCIASVMLGFDSTSRISIKNISNSSSIKELTENEELEREQIQLVKSLSTVEPNLELIKLEKERRASVTYNRNDITILSNITVEEMEQVLLNCKGSSTMVHLSSAFVDAEEKYDINAFVIAGIVALESGFATSRRAVEDNNLTGFEVYSDDSEGRLFTNQHESILYTAKHLQKNYLSEDGPYYHGLSVDDVQISYCPDEGENKRWEEKVDSIASSFLQVYEDLYNN